MDLIEFYRIDENNPGDLYSNPCRYFFPLWETKKYDIDKIKKTTWNQEDVIVVGGGGLLGNENFEYFMNRIMTHPDVQLVKDVLDIKLKDTTPKNKQLLMFWKQKIQTTTVEIMNQLDREVGLRILWGAGYNTKDKDKDPYDINYPDYINQFHLVGIRDWDVGYRWVPCASCMHDAFNNKYEIKNKVVWFEHKKRLIDSRVFDLMPCPRMVNTGQNMEQILEFLGSAEVVVTNSYHGVYWATLLGRKVVCIPWGSKFNMFKHPPTMATNENWAEKINEAREYPHALAECKRANQNFYTDVVKLMNANKDDNSRSIP